MRFDPSPGHGQPHTSRIGCQFNPARGQSPLDVREFVRTVGQSPFPKPNLSLVDPQNRAEIGLCQSRQCSCGLQLTGRDQSWSNYAYHFSKGPPTDYAQAYCKWRDEWLQSHSVARHQSGRGEPWRQPQNPAAPVSGSASPWTFAACADAFCVLMLA